jgi:mRNA interferase HigB
LDGLDAFGCLCIHYVCVRIIKESTLRDFAARHPEAAPGLEVWRRVMRLESFRHFADLRRCFRSADQVRVGSGSAVVVFNIHGNNYRLICAIHYNTGKVFLLRFLTHADYDKDRWKDEL